MRISEVRVRCTGHLSAISISFLRCSASSAPSIAITRSNWSSIPTRVSHSAQSSAWILLCDSVTVTLKHSKIHAEDCAECETKAGMLDQIDRVIAMEGTLDAEQRGKLMEIADKCPVHRTLTSEVRILTRAAD